MELVSRAKSFGGSQEVYSHLSEACRVPMKFAIYLPEIKPKEKLPVLYWLSGLTCTEQNFIQKSGFQQFASQFKVCVVACDTSPRGLNLPGEDDSYDFGSGAGFYVNATREPWAKNYQMYSYVSEELPQLIAKNFPVDPDRQSIFGHSMGGHGALVIALRNPERFKSVSAFAPIAAATTCPWGQKAFKGYLGDDQKTWEPYDAHLLVKISKYDRPILIDQGESDEFLRNQLQPEKFRETCEARGIDLRLRYQEGYDHSYYFISTFMGDHFRFHKSALS